MSDSQDFRYVSDLWRFPPGTVIDGRFEIRSAATRRSFGTVFEAWDLKKDVRKTLLFIPHSLMEDPETLAYIQEESGLVRWLDHPMIARLYDLHVGPKYAYFEMEYVPGKSLNQKKLERPDKKLSENTVRWLGVQILDALEYAHNQNVLHRDIKPKNVVLTPDGKVKLIDFGISEILRASTSRLWDTTPQTTILYMSPEQLTGRQLSVPSDIYSVAATLYDLLNGQPPFFTGDVYTQILREPAKPIPGISTDLNQILLKALEKDPLKRFASCREMKAELAQPGYQMHIKTQAQPQAETATPQPKTRAARETVAPRRRNPSLKYMIVIILLIMAVSYLTTHYLHREKRGAAGDSTATAIQKATQDTFKIKMFRALVEQGDRKFDRKLYFEPKGSNALELYAQAQKIFARDSHVVARLHQLTGLLKDEVIRFMQNGDWQKSEELLNVGQKALPKEEAFRELRRMLTEQKQAQKIKIAVLNGCGIKGIARQAAEVLRANGFDVVYVENYRVNGRINWRVTHSRLTGKLTGLPQIGVLSQLVGREYQLQRTWPLKEKQGNVALILGKDYRTLPLFKQ